MIFLLCAPQATHHGWLTYHAAADGYSYLHSNGTESEAMTVEFVLVNEQQGTYVMVNLGKAGDDKTKAKKRRSAPYPALGDYISWHSNANSDWVSSKPSWGLTAAMTVEMWQPGKAAPPPPPPGPPAPTPCAKRFDFR